MKQNWSGILITFGLVQLVSVIVWGISVERRISVETTRFDELERRIASFDTPLGRKVTQMEQRMMNDEEHVIALSLKNSELDTMLRRLPVIDDRQERILKTIERIETSLRRSKIMD